MIKCSLDGDYSLIFNDVLDVITKEVFTEDVSIKPTIESNLNIEELLKHNSKLKYKLGDINMPESYNGLGLSNLIYIFIQIICFKIMIEKEKKLFNLLFIEEPESHLHPQIQLAFFRKMEKVIGSDENIYKIVSTHSSYVLKSSTFESISYFCCQNNEVNIKSIIDFINKNETFQIFLKKYFEVDTCDLFFADKAVFVEGSTERLLFPTIIKKFDLLTKDNNLGRQHISMLEVGGRYANIFYELLDFLELKSLIITDNDSINQDNKRCSCNIEDDIKTGKNQIEISNGVIKNWFNKKGKEFYVTELMNIDKDNLIKSNSNGKEILHLATQIPNKELGILHCGRTFEEEIILENLEAFTNALKGEIEKDLDGNEKKVIKLPSLKESSDRYIKDYDSLNESQIRDNIFDIVDKLDKVDFILDLISADEIWSIPRYILEGLKWLQK